MRMYPFQIESLIARELGHRVQMSWSLRLLGTSSHVFGVHYGSRLMVLMFDGGIYSHIYQNQQLLAFI